jgi:hypothetical protein
MIYTGKYYRRRGEIYEITMRRSKRKSSMSLKERFSSRSLYSGQKAGSFSCTLTPCLREYNNRILMSMLSTIGQKM